MVHIKSIYSSYILTESVYFDISHVTNRSELQLQLLNRVRIVTCRLRGTSAVSVLTTPSVDVVTVVFHRICLKAMATFAGRVGESIQTTCVVLPWAVWSGKPSGRVNRGTSTSQSLFVVTQSTSLRPTTTQCELTCKLTRFKCTLYKLKFKYQNPRIIYFALCCACLKL